MEYLLFPIHKCHHMYYLHVKLYAMTLADGLFHLIQIGRTSISHYIPAWKIHITKRRKNEVQNEMPIRIRSQATEIRGP